MVLKILLLAIILMSIVLFLFSIGIIFKQNGKFPSLHIGAHKEMAKRGITCATSQDREARIKGKGF